MVIHLPNVTPLARGVLPNLNRYRYPGTNSAAAIRQRCLIFLLMGITSPITSARRLLIHDAYSIALEHNPITPVLFANSLSAPNRANAAGQQRASSLSSPAPAPSLSRLSERAVRKCGMIVFRPKVKTSC